VSIRVLLVEDDRELRSTLRQALEVEGYAVQPAASAADAAAQWRHGGAGAFAIVLLDLGLPDADGTSLLAMLRGRGDAAVIVVSARDGEGDKVALLDQGADDYLVKPFSIGELLARMRVALRHRGHAAQPAMTRYRFQGLDVDVAAHAVRVDGEPVHLTPTEFKLLARLVRNAGQVITHARLLTDVWGADYVGHTHYLRLYMGQLRAKLERDPADPQRLLTEPGIGYRLVPPEA
jgi:two-component system KDP operon response regulator KdpE